MGHRASVLVVEDNAETRFLLQRMLAMKGYSCHCEEDAEGALRWLHAGNRPAIIILDLYLPGMSGQSFLRELEPDAALSAIPVVAFTAHSGPAPEGVTAFIRKGSDDPDVLLGALEACLRT